MSRGARARQRPDGGAAWRGLAGRGLAAGHGLGRARPGLVGDAHGASGAVARRGRRWHAGHQPRAMVRPLADPEIEQEREKEEREGLRERERENEREFGRRERGI